MIRNINYFVLRINVASSTRLMISPPKITVYPSTEEMPGDAEVKMLYWIYGQVTERKLLPEHNVAFLGGDSDFSCWMDSRSILSPYITYVVTFFACCTTTFGKTTW